MPRITANESIKILTLYVHEEKYRKLAVKMEQVVFREKNGLLLRYGWHFRGEE